MVPEARGDDPLENAAQATTDADEARQRAIQQIERRRSFKRQLVVSGVLMLVLVFVWAQSEYSNAGGWPTDGFSNSSSIPNVWNYWIIYPIIIWACVMGLRAWPLYRGKPISDREIEAEIKRQS